MAYRDAWVADRRQSSCCTVEPVLRASVDKSWKIFFAHSSSCSCRCCGSSLSSRVVTSHVILGKNYANLCSFPVFEEIDKTAFIQGVLTGRWRRLGRCCWRRSTNERQQQRR